eukprot:scaffold217387_cov25-Prasinocladus_malaysianus.AAC.1
MKPSRAVTLDFTMSLSGVNATAHPEQLRMRWIHMVLGVASLPRTAPAGNRRAASNEGGLERTATSRYPDAHGA